MRTAELAEIFEEKLDMYVASYKELLTEYHHSDILSLT